MLGCQDKVYNLVVNLPIRGIPGCCPRQLVGVESVGKGESVALCELSESPSSVICLSNAKSSYCPCLVLVYQGLLWHSNCLELQVNPSWESLLWYYQADYRTVHGLMLVHGPEWLMYGLAEIQIVRIEMSLLEMGVQLKILSTFPFRTMTVTPYWCYVSHLG